MKKVFVVTILLVFAVLSVFAMPKDEAVKKFDLMTSVTQDGKLPEIAAVKDSFAQAAGFKGILFLDGDFRGFAPTPSNSSVSSKDGDTIQVISGLSDHGDLVGMLGVYYTVSFDGGATWTAPLLITSAGPFSRNYNEIAVADGQYPYVLVNYRTPAYFGNWFTTDPLGPNGGGWTSPLLVTDTANFAAYMPTISVNAAGDKVCMLAYDAVGGIGSNYSTDYGATWSTYDLPAELNDSIWGPDVCASRWGQGDVVHAIVGMSWYDEVRYDIAGASAAFYEGYSKSIDGGATWSVPIGIYNGERRTNIPSINGDTFTYYIDTIDNEAVDSTAVLAYLDEATGYWADDQGIIDGGAFGFGTWWYWWDAEYFAEEDRFFYAIPMADLFIDYYVSGDLYTYQWQGQSILFGFKDDADAEFTYDYIDIHDAAIIDTLGASATWRGNAYSASVTYDKADGSIYIIYNDYVDTTTGEGSVEALRINNFEIHRATLSLNAAPYSVEASAYISDDHFVHVVMAPGTLDSIYYKAIDVTDAGLVWEYLGVSSYDSKFDGVNTGRVIANAENSIFSMPSIVKNDSKISFTLKSNMEVNISLYDVTGRIVKNLANNSFTKGTHTINMNSNDFNQGVYFVKINAGDTSVSKKVIVVK
ncbi:MAG: T9SS type A sorting domain-containing protein [bacterium]